MPLPLKIYFANLYKRNKPSIIGKYIAMNLQHRDIMYRSYLNKPNLIWRTMFPDLKENIPFVLIIARIWIYLTLDKNRLERLITILLLTLVVLGVQTFLLTLWMLLYMMKERAKREGIMFVAFYIKKNSEMMAFLN